MHENTMYGLFLASAAMLSTGLAIHGKKTTATFDAIHAQVRAGTAEVLCGGFSTTKNSWSNPPILSGKMVVESGGIAYSLSSTHNPGAGSTRQVTIVENPDEECKAL